jgi:hypothetical protein
VIDNLAAQAAKAQGRTFRLLARRSPTRATSLRYAARRANCSTNSPCTCRRCRQWHLWKS